MSLSMGCQLTICPVGVGAEFIPCEEQGLAANPLAPGTASRGHLATFNPSLTSFRAVNILFHDGLIGNEKQAAKEMIMKNRAFFMGGIIFLSLLTFSCSRTKQTVLSGKIRNPQNKSFTVNQQAVGEKIPRMF